MANLKSLPAKSDIQLHLQAVSVACFFAGVQVILSCFFTCLVTFCQKLGILDNITQQLSTGAPPPLRALYCYLLVNFFSDWLHYFIETYLLSPFALKCEVLMLLLRHVAFGMPTVTLGLTVVLAGLFLTLNPDHVQLLNSTDCCCF